MRGQNALTFPFVFSSCPSTGIKLDRSFVSSVSAKSGAGIFSIVIAKAWRLSSDVVAEGVETLDPEPFSRLLLAGRSVQWKEPPPGVASERAEFELDAASAT